jgi:hypothetical protein
MNKESIFTEEIVKGLWTKTYNSEGKPDWLHIFQYYHPDIIFRDPIQKIEGIDEFKEMCNRLTNRCSKLVMNIVLILKKDNIIFMEWVMTMVFRRLPNTSMHGCTKLTLHEDGRIIEQRDYYDLWGDIFDRVPIFHWRYRRFMQLFFG